MLPSAELSLLRAPYEAADVFLITTSANRLTAQTSGASDLVGNHAGNRRQEYRRNDADGLVGRREGERQRADRHQHDGNYQRRLAAVTVGIGAKDDAADGP